LPSSSSDSRREPSTPPDVLAELTPVMRSVVERMARAGRPPLHSLTPVEARAAYAAGAGVLDIARPMLARVEDFRIAGRGDRLIPARLYAPSGERLPVLLYFHGGGFTVGSIETHDTLCRELARRSGCAVVSVGYRLAPEHRFPAAVDDAWDALAWLWAHAGIRLGLDPDRIAVGGDSAGGTLAAVTAIQARDAKIPLALQLLVYPGCGARQDTPSHHRYAHGPVLSETLIDWFFDQYLPDTAGRDDWRFAPLLADDVDGVAPAWIGLAESDPVRDAAIAYGDKLRAAGVPVDLEIYRGVAHEFFKMGRAVPEALRGHADAAAALRAALRPDAVGDLIPVRGDPGLRIGGWQESRDLAAPVRSEVFVREQGVPEDLEMDAADAFALHAVICDDDGLPVATGRLLPPEADRSANGPVSRIGRMTVLASHRGRALGGRVLDALVDAARRRGDGRIELHAQCHASDFYLRRGFMPQGGAFEEAGIPHVTMALDLRAPR
jgi:acetyl esterase